MKTLKIRKRYLAAAGAALLLAAGMPAWAGKLDGAQYLGSAKLSLSQARSTAMKTVPGKIVAQELEKEPGGSGLRYSFDIRYQGKVHEVGIDAATGKVLENGIENAANEAKEAAQDRKAHEAAEERKEADDDND
ncbi:MAG: PepSY domain-containing protein [Rhodanobacteraceae bacterium]